MIIIKGKCKTCELKKEGITLIIEYDDEKINATRRLIEFYCFDCLKIDSVIKILVHE